MSTSADTMASISMGRHNVDEEMPEDQVNIGSIVSRKTSDRRYLPKKLGNMKVYLHTTPLNETLDLSHDDIQRRFDLFELSLSDFSDFGKSLISGAKGAAGDMKSAASDDMVASGLAVGSAFIPFVGDIYSGYRAFKNFEDIKSTVGDLQKYLKSAAGDVNLFAPPEETSEKLLSGDIELSARTSSDRELIKDQANRVAVLCIEFLSNAIAAIPLEAVGLAAVDTGIDIAMQAALGIGSVADPEGDKAAAEFYEAALKLGGVIPGIIQKIEASNIPLKEKVLNIAKGVLEISNVIGNLALVYMQLADIEIESKSGESDDMPLAERRSRKKRRRTDEFSGVGAVAGYTGPLAGPKDPKKFYNTMAKVAGSEYLVDPAKTLKPKP